MVKPQVLVAAVALATTVVLQGASIAQAQFLTLDSFVEPMPGDPTGTISTDPMGAPSSNTTNPLTASSSDIFTERDRVVTSTSGTVTSTVIGGFDFISGSPGGGQQYLLIYDGSTDSTSQTDISGTFGSLGGVNLINGTNNALRFNFSGALTEASSNVDIRAIGGGGDVTVNSAFTPADGTLTYDVAFSSFTGVDFSNLDALIIQYDDLESANFTVDSIQAVPEPTTILGTIGAICMGAGLALRYRKRLNAS